MGISLTVSFASVRGNVPPNPSPRRSPCISPRFFMTTEDIPEQAQDSRRQFRLRFSLLSMFAVVTLVCVIFGLTYRRHGAEAEIQFHVGSRPPSLSDDGKFDAREFEIYQK